MPYVKQDERADVELMVEELAHNIYTFGQANYVITSLLLRTFDPTCYADFNSLVGVLECAKLEFYRRAVAKYEDEKIKENGDVYQ